MVRLFFPALLGDETIRDIFNLYEAMPEGEHKDRLLDEISKLDVMWE